MVPFLVTCSAPTKTPQLKGSDFHIPSTYPVINHYPWSISTSAQYVTLDNKIKCLSLALFFLGNPTNKTVTGTGYTWELLIVNQLGQSL